MKAIIVDDEILARERILDLLEKHQEIVIVDQCSNGKSAIEAINKWNPELLFLDIDMKDLNGFDVLEQIDVSPKPTVIFVTAHDKYALKAFDFDPLDFLHKPFKENRFDRTITKVLETRKKSGDKDFEQKLKHLLKIYEGEKEEKKQVQKIAIKSGNKTLLVDLQEISYIIASGAYAEVYAENKKYVIRESLGTLINSLNSDFIRVHRSAIINVQYIKEIIHSDYTEVDVKMKDSKIIRISQSRKKDFFQQIGI